jgi:hypothetical protein
MSFVEFLSQLSWWQTVGFILSVILCIYGLCSFIFLPITSRLNKIEKYLKEIKLQDNKQ